MRIVLKDKYIEAAGWYIGRVQAKAIISGKAKRVRCEGHRFNPDSHSACGMTAEIRERGSGSIRIGCSLISKPQVDRVRKWLRA